jgi:hypothetical protein
MAFKTSYWLYSIAVAVSLTACCVTIIPSATSSILALCSLGIKEENAFKLEGELHKISASGEKSVFGFLGSLVANEKLAKYLPVTDLLDAYKGCLENIKVSGNELQDAKGLTIDPKRVTEIQNGIVTTINKLVQYATEKAMNPSSTADVYIISKEAEVALSQSPRPVIGTKVDIFLKDGQVDKDIDRSKLGMIIKKQGFELIKDSAINSNKPTVKIKDPVNKWHKTNAIWYSPTKTSFQDVKTVALLLIQAGARITSIQPYKQTSTRYDRNIVQVGAFPDTVLKEPVSVSTIKNATQAQFPRIDPE